MKGFYYRVKDKDDVLITERIVTDCTVGIIKDQFETITQSINTNAIDEFKILSFEFDISGEELEGFKI